jgi:hypothetical protein
MLLLPAILETYRSLVDRSFKVVFATMELTPEQAGALNESIQKAGFLAFKVDKFKQKEIEAIESLESDYEDKGKTPGQRLRAVLFVNFSFNAEGYENFNDYYNLHMNRIINDYKKRLP